MKNRISAFVELTKPRILLMVLITAALGYFLGAGRLWFWGQALVLLLGTACVCAGSAALNHYLEKDIDQKMERTKRRPLPSGIIAGNDAMLFGITLILAGVLILFAGVNLLTAFLGLLTAFLYVLVYTPIKRISWLNTSIGAIPGALPPMGGWTAATGELSPEAWVLFWILFIWQHPHFYSIAWMCKEDYKKGGLQMLPVVEPDGRSTFRQINLFNGFLLLAVILPFIIGMSGHIYLFAAIALTLIFSLSGFKLNVSRSIPDAQAVLRNSVIYLPTILLLILLDGKL